MPNKAVNKGKRGERELSIYLGRVVGDIIVADPHGNGADIQAIPGLAIEVKRQETLNLSLWWGQALKQGEELDRVPVLAWRTNRKSWSFGLPGYLLTAVGSDRDMIILGESSFNHWLRLWLRS